MTNEKFTEQAVTLAKFLQTYCADKHALKLKREINLELTYKGKNLNDSVRTQLCAECEQLFFYAHERLLACSHDIKPSCRKCPHPCYEKPRWTQMAKIMKYSGVKLGLVKLKKIFTFSKTAE